MANYRILIVDDEKGVRETIRDKMNWEELGFSDVHDAENGRDALEKIELLRPDVLLTDIRMPYMDGLKLCEQVRKKYPSMKLLIFSGFDDFEYAKQAIRLKVTEYVLKPVNIYELTEIMGRVKNMLDEELKARKDIDTIRTNFENSIPVLQEVFLGRALKESLPQEEIDEGLERYRIPLKQAKKWDVVAASTQDGNLKDENTILSIAAFVGDFLKNYYRFSMVRTNECLSTIIAIDNDNTKTEMMDLLDELSMECERIFGIKIVIGIGHSCENLTQLPGAYQSAVEALRYGQEKKRDTVVYINDIVWDQDNAAAKAVLQAKKYIQSHYTDPELSADEICRFLCVSPNYFSTIFKKETGQTYIAYLTQIRLDKAIELLENTNDKTYVIAEKIGYQDQNYFSYVFKKKYGISPTKYRRSREG